MDIHVIHVVESTVPSAGTVSVCLPGLLDSLRKSGLQGMAVDSFEEWDSQFLSAQIVHIHGWDYPLALRAAAASKKAGKPYILSPLGHLTQSPFNRKRFGRRLRNFFVERPLVRSARAVTAVNEIDQISLRATEEHANILLLPYGIRFQDYEEKATNALVSETQENSHNKLLMLDPLEPRFGCVVALKAIAELGPLADGWTVTLAGDDRGQWRGKLEAAVRRKGGEARVIFENAKTPAEQKKLLGEASALVAPSLHVSTAVSIMQAVASGVPVVATQNAAPPDLSDKVRVCGPSRAELREALRDLMQMPLIQRQEAARAAREKARIAFDWSVLAPRYAAAYKACLQN